MIESDDQPNDSDIFTRMAAVEYRLMRVEFRLARIENTNAQLQETIAHVDYVTDAFERVVDQIDEVENRLNARMNEHFAEVNKRFDSQDAKLELTLRAIVGEVNRISAPLTAPALLPPQSEPAVDLQFVQSEYTTSI